MHYMPTKAAVHDWSNVVSKPAALISSGGGGSGGDQLCDNFSGMTLNELASSQNSLCLSIGANLVNPIAETSTLVNGVVAAASVSAGQSLFGTNTNPIINIINNNNNSCSANMNSGDDHDTSFSKNGTEILDFEPSTNVNSCDSCSHSLPNHQAQV